MSLSKDVCYTVKDAVDWYFPPTARRFYKDVIFDTSPVAGKVYKNSENRRKQGVSCGFRCISRCSIGPIKAAAGGRLMLASGLLCGWLRKKLKGSSKIKKYNYARKIFIRALNNASTSSSVLDFPRETRTVPLA